MIVSGYAGALGLGYGILTAGVITIRRGKVIRHAACARGAPTSVRLRQPRLTPPPRNGLQGIGAGDGGDEELQRRIRGHGASEPYTHAPAGCRVRHSRRGRKRCSNLLV